MNIVEVLQQTISPDQNARLAATQYLENAAQQNMPMFLGALAVELAKESNPELARQAAGLQLKNQLTSKDDNQRIALHQRWLGIDAQTRNEIKAQLLHALNSSSKGVGATSAQAVAAMAMAELPQGQWMELVPSLLQFATDPNSSENLKQATLETIGYMCEEIDPSILLHYANPILTAIINGMRKEEPSNSVKLAATTALLNSLEFIKNNFDNDGERNYIMQVVCEATQCPDVQVVVRALQCLVKIMSLYYHYMEYYMRQALFQLTLQAMNSSEDDVVLQAVEFWSTVCDEELELAMELQEASENGTTPNRVSKYYARGALQYLVPIVTDILTRQDETDDEDAWNPATAAGVCVALMAMVCEDAIVEPIMPFIVNNVHDQDWHKREAAVLALGSILEGPNPDNLTPIVTSALPTLTQLMRDSSVHVKDTAAWTIGRVCEFLPQTALEHNALRALVEVLVTGMDDAPRVASNVCWAFNTLAEAAYDQVSGSLDDDDEEVPTFALSPYFEIVVQKLLVVTERVDGGENNLRSAAYEALMQMLSNSATDCYPTLEKVTVVIIDRLERALHKQDGHDVTDRLVHSEVQSLLCATLQVVLRKLRKEHVVQLSQRVMNILVYMFQLSANQGQGGVQEDALMAITALINAMEQGFIQYMEAFKPYLLLGLRNHQEHGVCNLCVGLIGDICRALTTDVLPYCDELMNQLLANLSDPTLHRSVKPSILSAFGDVAIAIGPSFLKYVQHTLAVLDQAAQTQIDAKNYELVEYQNQLREGVLDAYTGIIIGLKGDDQKTFNPNVYQLKPYVVPVMSFIQRCAEDRDHTDTIVRSCCGMIGDFCEIFRQDMRPLLEQAWVSRLLKEGRASSNGNTRKTAEWAGKTIREKCGAVNH
eukprot:comp23506_c0_seq1/m.39386 comp23506_c0_seq1/g.39386  ORF comp23506_c0_seq1/g.39386 comp23506_c0_seq1/m.39386 type:complete len:883 (-) comp23506_c0_seq1:641-3289(-)